MSEIGTFQKIGLKMDNAINTVKQFAKSDQGKKMILNAKMTALAAAFVFTVLAGATATVLAVGCVALAAASVPPFILLVPFVAMAGISLTLLAIEQIGKKMGQLDKEYNQLCQKQTFSD